MMLEIPDDVDGVEVNLYRNGVLSEKLVFSYDDIHAAARPETVALGGGPEGLWFEDENGLIIRSHDTVQ